MARELRPWQRNRDLPPAWSRPDDDTEGEGHFEWPGGQPPSVNQRRGKPMFLAEQAMKMEKQIKKARMYHRFGY